MAKPTLETALKTVFLLALVSLIPSSLIAHWSDSELWAITSSQLFGTVNLNIAAQGYKPLFNFVLSQIYLFELGNLQTIHAARLIFAVIGITFGGLVYILSRQMRLNHAVSLWCAFLFTTTTFFLSQGFRVRSDLLAGIFQILALIPFLIVAKDNRPVQARYYLYSIAATLAMLASTPKSVYMLLTNCVFVGFVVWRRRPHLLKFASITLGIPILMGIGIAILAPQSFEAAFDYFLSSFKEKLGRPGYISELAFFYVFRFLKENPHFPLFYFISFLGTSRTLQVADEFRCGLQFSAALSLFIIIAHNDRLPFFILSMLPFIAIYVGVKSWNFLATRPKMRSLAIVLITANGLFFTVQMADYGSNDVQSESLNIIETYLKRHPRTRYYDSIGVLPRGNQYYLWPESDDEHNFYSIDQIISSPDLDLVFIGNRLFLHFEKLMESLEKEFFIKVSPGVFAKSYVMNTNGQRSLDYKSLLRICSALRYPKKLYVYEGSHFLQMQKMVHVAFPWQCGQCFDGNLTLESHERFFAFSAYEPLWLPNGKSFAEVFDHNFEF